jgi:TIR domain
MLVFGGVVSTRGRMAAMGAVRKSVFVSYSHADSGWLQRLQVHMRPLVRDADVEWWDDTMIKAGADWRSDIERALASAKVAVLLVSAEFLASDFIANDELPTLLRAAEEEGAIILPLILRPSRFSHIPSLARFQAINPPDRPLAKLKRWEQDEFLAKTADAIEDALAAASKAPQGRRAAARPADRSPRIGTSAERRSRPKAPHAKTRAATSRSKQSAQTKERLRSRKAEASPRLEQGTFPAAEKPALSSSELVRVAIPERSRRPAQRNIEGELRAAGVPAVSPELPGRLTTQLAADEKIVAGCGFEHSHVGTWAVVVRRYPEGDMPAGDLIATDRRLLLFPRGTNEVQEVPWANLSANNLVAETSVGSVVGSRAQAVLQFTLGGYSWGHIVIDDAEHAQRLRNVANAQIRAAGRPTR